jgi:hypothetical protein
MLLDIITSLALVLQKECDLRHKLWDYWSGLEQFCTPFHINTMKQDRFLHALQFFNFADCSKRCEQKEEYDQLWRLRLIFDSLYYICTEFCNLSEHLAVNEIIVQFKGSIIFRHYIPMKRKHFGFKIYKLCDDSGCADDVKMYLGKDTGTSTRNLTHKIKGVGHRVLIDNFFLLAYTFWWLKDQAHVYSCRKVEPIQKNVPSNFSLKKLKFKWSLIQVMTRGGLTVIVWKYGRQACILSNMNEAPAEGNLCDERKNILKIL